MLLRGGWLCGEGGNGAPWAETVRAAGSHLPVDLLIGGQGLAAIGHVDGLATLNRACVPEIGPALSQEALMRGGQDLIGRLSTPSLLRCQHPAAL